MQVSISISHSLIHRYIVIMEGINCDGEGGWTRVAYLNMTEPNATCPTGLILQEYDNIDHPLCGRHDRAGCNSTIFSSTGLMYSKVCGQVRGYQYYALHAFRSLGVGIDSYYVDGVSITYGTNPRKHNWTYAAGITEKKLVTVLVHVTLVIKVVVILIQHLLGLTIIVSLGIPYVTGLIFFMLMIHYGMVSSVMVKKVLVVQLTLQYLGFIDH